MPGKHRVQPEVSVPQFTFTPDRLISVSHKGRGENIKIETEREEQRGGRGKGRRREEEKEEGGGGEEEGSLEPKVTGHVTP